MPTFLPRIKGGISCSRRLEEGQGSGRTSLWVDVTGTETDLGLGLDLDEDTSRNNQAVQRFDGSCIGIVDIDDALVGSDLELLT